MAQEEDPTDADATSRRTVTIFVSSPSDVLPERIQVDQSVDRLRMEFGEYFDLEVVRWEEHPVHAGEHPQAQIPEPAATDIVVVILWSRLGTPLIHRDNWERGFVGPLSGGEVTGTEWEFENALAGYQVSGDRPVVLLFRKLGVPRHRTDDEVRAYLDGKEILDHFIERWFHDPATGALLHALTEFGDQTDFERLIDRDLHELLTRFVEQERGAGPVAWATSPFVGLMAYDVDDAPIFFGREYARVQLRHLIEERAAARGEWVLVTGASGSGKSSLVRAGLLADLRCAGLVEGVGECRYAIIRPSDPDGDSDPIAALAAQLLSPHGLHELDQLRYDPLTVRRQISSGQAALLARQGLDLACRGLSDQYRAVLVVVIDQFEEFFLQPTVRRNELLRALVDLTADDDVWLIATMRSDALQLLDEDADLARHFPGEARHLVAPPTDLELDRIITRPARAAGVSFERHVIHDERLNHRILEDARRDRVSLPLIEHALQQLWIRRTSDGDLTYDAYEKLGGLGGGIGRAAAGVLRQEDLDEDQLGALRRALLSMARLGDDQTWSRRVVRKDTLDPSIRPVISVLEEHRLLVSDDRGSHPTVELAHEELFRSWDLLAGWLRDSLPDHRLMRELEVAAEAHLSNPDDNDRLWKGVRLDRATELRDLGVLPVDESIRRFIAASETDAAARHSQEVRSRTRRLRRVTVVAFALGTLTVAAGIAFVFARQQARRADDNAMQAKAVELAATSAQLTDQSLDLALLLAAESARRRPTPDVEETLVTTLGRLPELRTILRGHGAEVRDVTVTGDGTIVSAGRDGRIVWWSNDGSLIGSVDVGHEVHGLAALPEGTAVISTSDDGVIRRWEAPGQEAWAVQGHAGDVRRAEVDPLGRWVASAAHDGSVRVTELTAGSEVTTLRPSANPDVQQVDVTVSADGTYLATVALDGEVAVFQTSDWREMDRLTLESVGRAADFHPLLDNVIAVGETNGEVNIFDVVTHERTLVHQHEERVFDVAFDRRGVQLASAGRDQRAIVTEVRTDNGSLTAGETKARLEGHAADVRAVAFGPGDELISGSRDRTVMIWELDAPPRLSSRPLGDAPAYEVVATQHATSATILALVMPGPDGVSLIGTSGNQPIEFPVRSFAMAVADGGDLVVIGDENGDVRFVRPVLGRSEAGIPTHADEVRAVVVDPVGRRAATGGADGTIAAWNLADHAVEARTELADFGVQDLVFVGDDRLLIADDNGSLWMWEPRTGDTELTQVADNRLRARSLAITSDGGSVIVGTDQEQVQVWSLDGGEMTVTAELGHDGEASTVAVDASGRIVATSAAGGTVTMWDLETGRRRGQLRASQPRAVDFDGTDHVVVATADGVLVWNLDLEVMVEIACRVANRNLTVEEWDRWVGGAYRQTCPQFPLHGEDT